MSDFKLGKKIYSSKMLWPLRLLVIFICILLLLNLYYQTFNDPNFFKWEDKSFLGILKFHYFYPEEVLSFIVSVLFPTVYYSFIRSMRFYEHGIVLNRGLPFFNRTIPYSKIKTYKIVHPKYLLSLLRQDTHDEILFSVTNMERAMAIFDNNGIKGELSSHEFQKTVSGNKKFIIYVLIFSIMMYFIQYFGFARYIFR